jgi:hypothetical protein
VAIMDRRSSRALGWAEAYALDGAAGAAREHRTL